MENNLQFSIFNAYMEQQKLKSTLASWLLIQTFSDFISNKKALQ